MLQYKHMVENLSFPSSTDSKATYDGKYKMNKGMDGWMDWNDQERATQIFELDENING